MLDSLRHHLDDVNAQRVFSVEARPPQGGAAEPAARQIRQEARTRIMTLSSLIVSTRAIFLHELAEVHSQAVACALRGVVGQNGGVVFKYSAWIPDTVVPVSPAVSQRQGDEVRVRT